ncbi:hypothetical protein CF15_07925 [Pyrodictium occultum]|uniref:Uncharacterized protein n=1 Tax=Pyrodictium occultum TaxID=2309 RepID=A0A0V8RRE0_PYROC|nr:hypothetical protein [Pyrodictium occultum]KSW10704.1 hypothetical protein CF15_07925 [Pyrodictium occultum]
MRRQGEALSRRWGAVASEGAGRLEQRLERLLASLDRMKKLLEDIALDEMSEARAYGDLARLCHDEDSRWNLLLIAMDSIVHKEIAWALIRAASEIEVTVKEVLSYKPRPEDMGRLLGLLEAHATIEDLARSNYEGIVPLAEPGTTLRKLAELLTEEEAKHQRLVASALQRLQRLVEEGRGAGEARG